MRISIHLLSSAILAAILYRFVGLHSLWIIVGGFLIDVDHLFWTIGKFRYWSLAFSYEYHDDRHLTTYEKDILHIFHTVEFWALMILAGGISYLLGWIFIFWMFSLTFVGMVLHLLLDFSSLIKRGMVNVRAISLIGWLKRREYL